MPGTAFNTANWDGYDEHSEDISPGGALTSFSLLIDVSTLSSTWKSNVQSDAGDIRCTDEDDNELAYDLINWVYNAGAPTGLIRVLRSLGTSDSTQKVRVYAGYNAGGSAVAYDANETYGSDNAYDANWEGYWPDGGGTDRTSNGIDTSGSGGVSIGGTSGQLDLATTYDGSDDYSNVSQSAVTDEPCTQMAWIKPALGKSPGTQYVLAAMSTSYSASTTISANHLSTGIRSSDGGSTWDYCAEVETGVAAGGTPATAWHHIAGLFTANDDRECLVDSSSVGTNTTSRGVGGIDQLVIGAALTASGADDTFFDGDICEVQLHSVVRGSDWIQHEYSQSNDNATFWGTWSWNSAGGGGLGIPIAMHHYKMLAS